MRHPDRPDLVAARRRLAGRYGPAGAAPASQGLRDRGAVDEVLRAGQAAPDDLLAALAIVTVLRADLDRTERQLVTRVREQRVSWQRVADASGLGSRQAAEQRWLRLRAAPGREPTNEPPQRTGEPAHERPQRKHEPAHEQLPRKREPTRGRRQRNIDRSIGVASLRDRVAELHDQLARFPDQPGRPASLVRLARRTLAAAVEAPAGPLCDLARLAVADLREVPAGALDRGQSASVAQVSGALASQGTARARSSGRLAS